VGRKCGECKLAARGLCPSAVVPKGGTTKVKKEARVKVEVEMPSEEVEVKEETVVAEVNGVKVEDGDGLVGDIEDIGATPGSGRRTSRRKT
jgi:endonuclease-3